MRLFRNAMTVSKISSSTEARMVDIWPNLRSLFTQTHRLHIRSNNSIVLTNPVSSTGAQRSFSTLERVENYLRSTMSDNRLSSLCVISIEREMSDKLLSDTRPVLMA